jgi:hypothetical protein
LQTEQLSILSWSNLSHMESRLIYESSRTFIPKIYWPQIANTDSEWQYFDLDNPALIEDLINIFFITDTLHVSLGRHDSFTDEKSLIYNRIKPLIGQTDFKIWNDNFTKTIEVSKIGVCRTGHASS